MSIQEHSCKRQTGVKRLRIQFVGDHLVEQIIRGEKTASVARLEDVAVREDDYNDPLVIGAIYDVFDRSLTRRASIRITGMQVCRWDSIPEALWRGEANQSPDEFRRDHEEYFDHPGPEFEFVAYYFETIADEGGMPG